MRKSSILAASMLLGLGTMVAGCGGGSSFNPNLGENVNQIVTNFDARITGNLGVVLQSTDADGDGLSAEGLVAFNGNGAFSTANLSSLQFNSGNDTTTATGYTLEGGTYTVNGDDKTFTMSSDTLGFGSVQGAVANNGVFAAGGSIDADHDDGIVLYTVPASHVSDSSVSGIYNVTLSNVGNLGLVGFGTVAFDGSGNVTDAGSVELIENGTETSAANVTGGTYSVTSSGTFTATIDLSNDDVLTMTGFLGADGTLTTIASDLGDSSTVVVATPANVTNASDAFLSGSFTVLAEQLPTTGDDAQVGGVAFLNPTSNDHGSITSGTGTIFEDGVVGGLAVTDITGAYTVNPDGVFSDTSLSLSTGDGTSIGNITSFATDLDQTYAVGTFIGNGVSPIFSVIIR